MDLFSLHGRVAVVTGGNGGIGLAMAKGLLDAGAAVLIVGRNADKNRKALDMLSGAGRRIETIAADLASDEGGERVVAAAVERFGKLDILVNNAGTNVRKQPQEYSVAEWRMLLDVNLTSAFLCSKAAYPRMRANGGKIINIGSMTSLFGASFAAPYGASKGGVVQLTKALASAWAKDGIQVNAILPGWIDTDLTKRARTDVPDLHDKVVARTPAGRWGAPRRLWRARRSFSPAGRLILSRAQPFRSTEVIPRKVKAQPRKSARDRSAGQGAGFGLGASPPKERLCPSAGADAGGFALHRLAVASGRAAKHFSIVAIQRVLARPLFRAQRKSMEGIVYDQDVAAQYRAGEVDLPSPQQLGHFNMLVERLFAEIVSPALQAHAKRLQGRRSQLIGVEEVAVA